MADAKEKDEKQEKRAEMQKDLNDYNVAQNMLQNSIDDATGNIKKLTQNAGSIGGEVGKMIGQTATKSGISLIIFITGSLKIDCVPCIITFPLGPFSAHYFCCCCFSVLISFIVRSFSEKPLY